MRADAQISSTVNQGPEATPEYRTVDSLPSASLLAFTGASLDSFLYLNHGHVFAGVMTGNAVLCGVGVFNKDAGGALHYAWPLLAYACGIWLVAIAQRRIHRNSVRLTLSFVILGILAMSFVPKSFPDTVYAFLVVLLTGFLVGISRKVDSYAYNATVMTGTIRDATLSLYGALNARTRSANLRKARDLWTLMLSFFAGAVSGGVLGRHIGNHALWLPVATLCLVLTLVIRGGSDRTGIGAGSARLEEQAGR